MQHFMWQPDMLQVAKCLDAGVKRMQEIDPDAGSNPCRTSNQPGWLERCSSCLVLCGIPQLDCQLAVIYTL